jgi:hypothetical protein
LTICHRYAIIPHMNPNTKTSNPMPLPPQAEIPALAAANTMPGLPEAFEPRKTALAAVVGAGVLVLAAKTGAPTVPGKGLAEHAPDLGIALGPFAALAKLNLGKKIGEAKRALKKADLVVGKFVLGKVASISPLTAEKKAEKLADGKRALRTPKATIEDSVIKARSTKAKASHSHHKKAEARLRGGKAPRGDRKLRRQEERAQRKSANATEVARQHRYERQMRRQIASQIQGATGYNSSATPRTAEQRAYADKLIGLRDAAAVESSEATTKIAVGRRQDELDRPYAIQETGKKARLDLQCDDHGLYLNGAYDVSKGIDPISGNEVAVAGRTEKIRVDTSGVNSDHITFHNVPDLSDKPGKEKYIQAPDGSVYSLARHERHGQPPLVTIKKAEKNGHLTTAYKAGDKAYFQLKGTELRMITFDAKGRPEVKASDRYDFEPILRLATDGSEQAYLVSPDTGQQVALSTHAREGTSTENYVVGGVIKQRTIAFADMPYEMQLDGKPILLHAEKNVDDHGNKRDYVYVQAGSQERLEPNFFNDDGSIRIDDRGLLLTDDWHDKKRRKKRRENMHVSKAELDGEEKLYQTWKHKLHTADHNYTELHKHAMGRDRESLERTVKAWKADIKASDEHNKARQLNRQRRINKFAAIHRHVNKGKEQAKRGRALDIVTGQSKRRRFDRYQSRADQAATRLEKLEIGHVLLQRKTTDERRAVLNTLRGKRLARSAKRDDRERRFNPARP